MQKNSTLYLGSASPRRLELITQMGIPCEVLRYEMEEVMDQDLPPEQLCTDLADQKMDVCLSLYGTSRWIVTADTLIGLDNHKIGKPRHREEAEEMLNRIQGRSHQVFTGVCLASPGGERLTGWDRTDVEFAPMSSREIQNYLDTEEWKGVAGAYRIQEKGGIYISRINGTYFNVMGLPINLLYGMLRQLKFSI